MTNRSLRDARVAKKSISNVKKTNKHNQVKKRISIGQANKEVNGMPQQPELPNEFLQKIAESLALSIARKIVAESAEALILPETA
ncbi:MAG: hypothetical protein K0S76_152 [Herbinix sp.]|jgi:hypothetical protein|nr:hypothetical protein [Herbinix sp.]